MKERNHHNRPSWPRPAGSKQVWLSRSPQRLDSRREGPRGRAAALSSGATVTAAPRPPFRPARPQTAPVRASAQPAPPVPAASVCLALSVRASPLGHALLDRKGAASRPLLLLGGHRWPSSESSGRASPAGPLAGPARPAGRVGTARSARPRLPGKATWGGQASA